MKWAELIDKYFGLISKKSHIFFVIWLWSTKYRGYLSSEYSDADSAGHEHFESSTITNLTCNEGYRNACIWLSDPILLKPRKEVWIVQARSLTFFMKFSGLAGIRVRYGVIERLESQSGTIPDAASASDRHLSQERWILFWKILWRTKVLRRIDDKDKE